jgi:hypothetical protein
MSPIEARREILAKSRDRIEEDTAYAWAARAVAAYQLHRETGGETWIRDAAHYLDEAYEHAALADRTGTVLQDIRHLVDKSVPRGAI